MELSSSGGSSKRAKAPAAGNVIQVASCLVDGCSSDLSGCREYHRRHKVCEQHSKTPKVTIRGQEQRFCQQCSRFHSLIEFDEGKRSCRKRLDGHNRRRRKPQLESFHTNPGVFHSTHRQGSRLLSFSNPQMLAASGCGGWAAIGDVKRDQDDTSTMVFNSPSNYISNIDKQNLLSRASGDMSNNYNLQGTDPEASSSACFDQVSAISGNSQKMLLNGVSNSDGALSLLSSAAIQTQTRDDDPLNIGSSSHMMPDPRNIIPMPQSLLHNLHFSGIGGHVSHRMQTNPRVSDLLLDNNANLTTLHFQGDSSGNLVSHQTLSFSWD